MAFCDPEPTEPIQVQFRTSHGEGFIPRPELEMDHLPRKGDVIVFTDNDDAMSEWVVALVAWNVPRYKGTVVSVVIWLEHNG